MHFDDFEDGFRYELANRDFARIAMTQLRSRTRGRPDHPFWSGYARLEEFNAPIYAAAAQRAGIPYATAPTTRLRGEAVGRAPRALLREVLRLAYPRTVEYLEDIRRLRAAGPADEEQFLRYMEEQEEVRMMHAALRKDYRQCRTLVEDFTRSWTGTVDGSR